MVSRDSIPSDTRQTCLPLLRRAEFQGDLYDSHIEGRELYEPQQHAAGRNRRVRVSISMIHSLRPNNPFRFNACSTLLIRALSREGVVWDNFNQTIPMSTYLVAFVISEFHEHLEQGQFKVWARPSAINQAHYALKIGTAVLELLGDAFGQNYQLPKMDMIAIPDFAAGAMENWGLVTYREIQMLYTEEESSAVAQQIVASAIAHELSHMWFGNLVTPEWWGYLWLSEAFAKYFQYFVTADVRANLGMIAFEISLQSN